MALPGAVEYAAQPVREAYEALSKQRDLAEQRAQRAESKLRNKRADVAAAEKRLGEAQALRRKVDAAATAAAGTAAEDHFADQVEPVGRAVAHLEKQLTAARAAAEGEAKTEYDAAREAADALEARMAALIDATEALKEAGIAVREAAAA